MFKAAVLMTAILLAWLTVQSMWKRLARLAPDEDALAGRLGCHGCGCHDKCKNERT